MEKTRRIQRHLLNIICLEYNISPKDVLKPHGRGVNIPMGEKSARAAFLAVYKKLGFKQTEAARFLGVKNSNATNERKWFESDASCMKFADGVVDKVLADIL